MAKHLAEEHFNYKPLKCRDCVAGFYDQADFEHHQLFKNHKPGKVRVGVVAF